MDPEGRARHAGADAKVLRRLGDAAQHRPYEGALALVVRPGMEVIRDESEPKAAGLGGRRIADEVAGTVLLTGERVADLEHAAPIPRPIRRESRIQGGFRWVANRHQAPTGPGSRSGPHSGVRTVE
jgi:hypothetical protein